MTSFLTEPLSPATSAIRAVANFFTGSPRRPERDDIFKAGNVACITGSSSGIGKALARRCASIGMKVFMADIDAEELHEARDEIAAIAVSPHDIVAVPTDVSDPVAIEHLRNEVFKWCGKCNLLVNNAGIGSGGGALAPLSDWQRTMDVNTWGPIHGCQAFVPAMKESGEPGLIINTGSKQGITMPPGNLAYNTSKAALKCYTEGLEHELRSESGCRVRAALLIPGWVNTSIVLKQRRAAWDKAHPPSPPTQTPTPTEETDAGDGGDGGDGGGGGTTSDGGDGSRGLGETSGRRSSGFSSSSSSFSSFDPSRVPFHEAKPAPGAWMPDQVVDFLLGELALNRFYIVCPDNEVDRATDKKRMTWAMQDITEDRQPLSRWHPDFKEAFEAFLQSE